MGSHWDEPEQPALVVPDGLAGVLKEFAKAAIKAQPADLAAFGADFFAGLRKERALAAAAAHGDGPRLGVIICGAPAAGKCTQCARIVNKFGLCHISAGDLLRAEVANETEAGLAAKQYMDNGDLVPDELVVGMVVQRLAQPDAAQRGWLLDGFPRTSAQAEELAAAGVVPDLVLLVAVPDEVLVDRVAGRRLDPATGSIYHLSFNPPPADVPLDRLVQRSDDTEDKVKTRLAAFHTHTQAVLDHYKEQLVEVDGNREMSHVWTDVEAALRRMQLDKVALA